MCKNTEYKNVCEISKLRTDVARLTVACNNKDEYIDCLLVSKTTLESAVSSGSNLLHDLRDEIDGRDRTIDMLRCKVDESKYDNCELRSHIRAHLLKIEVLTKEIASLDESWGKRVRLAMDETDRYSKKNVKLIKRNVTLSRQVDELKSKLAESPKPTYITPDDDIARDRPAAEFRNNFGPILVDWVPGRKLVAVIELEDEYQFVDSLGDIWTECRVAVEG